MQLAKCDIMVSFPISSHILGIMKLLVMLILFIAIITVC